MTDREFAKLKQQVDQLRSAVDQQEGILKVLKKSLKDDFNCSSIEEAKQLLSKLEKKQQKEERDFLKAHKKFKRLLEELND